MANVSQYVDSPASEDESASSPPPSKKRRISKMDRDKNFNVPRRRVKPTPVLEEDELAAPARRSARATKPKERDETPNESLRGSPTPTPKATKGSARKTTPKTVKLKTGRRVKEDVFNEPDRLFGPHKSLLYSDDTDVLGILRSEKAIDLLSTTNLGYPFLDTTKKTLQHYVDVFKKEGAEGYHDPDWLNEALAATEERNAGVYDDYLNAKFKEEWGSDENQYYTDTEDEKDNAEADKESASTVADGHEESDAVGKGETT